MYLNEIYSKDLKMKRVLKKFYDEYPVCAFSKLTDRSIISSLNYNQTVYADDGNNFYEYIDKNILKSVEINKDFNWKYLSSKVINGKKDYIYPAEYFRELLLVNIEEAIEKYQELGYEFEEAESKVCQDIILLKISQKKIS